MAGLGWGARMLVNNQGQAACDCCLEVEPTPDTWPREKRRDGTTGVLCPVCFALPEQKEPVKMQVFTCTDHAGYWPVGVASVIVAPDEATARTMLDNALKLRKLDVTPYTLQTISTDEAGTYVLRDGDY